MVCDQLNTPCSVIQSANQTLKLFLLPQSLDVHHKGKVDMFFLSFFYFFKCALTTLNNDFKLTLPSLDMGQLFESLFMTRNQFSNLSHTHTHTVG